MKKYIVAIFLLIWPLICHGDGWFYASAITCTGDSCYDLCLQNFETSTAANDYTLDNSETWTFGGGTVATNDTTATVLRGTKQLKLTGSGGSNNYIYKVTGSRDEVWVFFRFKLSRIPGGAGDSIIFCYDDDPITTAAFQVNITSTGYLRAGASSLLGTQGATQLSADTAYYMWINCHKTGASAGHCDVYLSTNTTKPATTECTKSQTGTTQAQPETCILFLAPASGASSTSLYIDQVLVATTAIGDVPE